MSLENDEKLNRERIKELADALQSVAVHNAEQTLIMKQVKADVSSITYQLRGNGKPGLIEEVAASGRRIGAIEARWKSWDELVGGVKKHIGKAALGLLTLVGTIIGGQAWYTVTTTRQNAAQTQQIMQTLEQIQHGKDRSPP